MTDEGGGEWYAGETAELTSENDELGFEIFGVHWPFAKVILQKQEAEAAAQLVVTITSTGGLDGN